MIFAPYLPHECKEGKKIRPRRFGLLQIVNLYIRPSVLWVDEQSVSGAKQKGHKQPKQTILWSGAEKREERKRRKRKNQRIKNNKDKREVDI